METIKQDFPETSKIFQKYIVWFAFHLNSNLFKNQLVLTSYNMWT